MEEERNNIGGQEQYQTPELSVEQARKEQERIRERLEQEASQAAERHHSRSHEHLRDTVENKAEKSQEIKERFSSVEQEPPRDYAYESPDTLPRALTQARKQLNPYEQQVSKFIHNPAVESVSAVTGATVARPSGLLWGSIFSFLGTSAFYVTSLIFGYQYNAFVAIVAFVGGFTLGLILEFITRKTRTA